MPRLADAWLGAANVHYQARHFEDAASRYDRALSLKPELADAWLGRGNVFNEAGITTRLLPITIAR